MKWLMVYICGFVFFVLWLAVGSAPLSSGTATKEGCGNVTDVSDRSKGNAEALIRGRKHQ